MVRHCLSFLAAAFVLAHTGCAGVFSADCRWPAPAPHDPGEAHADKDKKSPKVLLEWAVGAKKEEDRDKKNGANQEDQKDGVNGNKKGNRNQGQENGSLGQENANGTDEQEKKLEPDRPHLAEASTTVGQGRVVLEAGYTFSEGGGNLQLQTYPEALLRIGMFANWFEFRIGQSFATQKNRTLTGLAGEVPGPHLIGAGQTPSGGGFGLGRARTETGAQDLYLGVKLGLTEQKQYLPESALVLQTTVPTGSSAFTAGQMLPGVNYDFSWDIVKDHFAIEGVISANRSRDDTGHLYVTIAEGLTPTLTLTPKLEVFLDLYGLFPAGAVGPRTGPQYYSVLGLVYYFSRDFAIDFRAGPGLTEHSSDYLIGTGLAARY